MWFGVIYICVLCWFIVHANSILLYLQKRRIRFEIEIFKKCLHNEMF